jgi:WD40 repeat protein
MPRPEISGISFRMAVARRVSAFTVVAWSPDGRYIAAAGGDGVIWLWRLGPPLACSRPPQGEGTSRARAIASRASGQAGYQLYECFPDRACLVSSGMKEAALY